MTKPMTMSDKEHKLVTMQLKSYDVAIIKCLFLISRLCKSLQYNADLLTPAHYSRISRLRKYLGKFLGMLYQKDIKEIDKATEAESLYLFDQIAMAANVKPEDRQEYSKHCMAFFNRTKIIS